MTLSTDSAAEQAEDGSRTQALMSLDDVNKTYLTRKGEPSEALRDTSIDIHEGQFVALVGPSGCGKSTLLGVCAGLHGATGGKISYKGTLGPPLAADMGMVFQNPALLPWRNVLMNVLLPEQILQLAPGPNRRHRALSLLEAVKLQGTENKYPHELSGGMQQRVAIARSLLHDPSVLLMDEPFGALDALTREDLNDQLQTIHMSERKTVLFVTHSLREAVFLSDRIIVLSSSPGTIAADIRNPIPRPRKVEAETSLDFRELESHVRACLER